MGYRGKVVEQEQRRELHAEGQDARRDRNGAPRQQVVGLALGPRRRLHTEAPPATDVPLAEPAPPRETRSDRRLNSAGREHIGTLSEDAFLAAAWRPTQVRGRRPWRSASSPTPTPRSCDFCSWLRRFFEIDEHD